MTADVCIRAERGGLSEEDFKQLGQEAEELLLWLPRGIKLCNTHTHTQKSEFPH